MVEKRTVTYNETKYLCRIDHRGCYSISRRATYAKGKPYCSLYNVNIWHLSMGMPRRGVAYEVLLRLTSQ